MSLLHQYKAFVGSLPLVLQYRQAYYEMRGHVAPGAALPAVHTWRDGDVQPSMTEYRELHRAANPIRRLQALAAELPTGGRATVTVPDRRLTFDLYRDESRPSDLVQAFLAEDTVPSPRAVYDHHSLASYINMPWATPDSVTSEQVIESVGKIRGQIASIRHVAQAEEAHAGTPFSVHAWVFTPPGFLLLMAQLALDGYVPFRLRAFRPEHPDRTSFTAQLETVDATFACALRRRSFLEPLGEDSP